MIKYSYHIYFLKNKDKYALFAWLIRLAIKRPYNHVEVVCIPEDSNLPVRFYGAVAPVSRMAGQKYINDHYDLVKVLTLKDSKGFSDIDNLKYLESMCGKPYSAVQIVLQALGAISFTFKRLTGRAQLNYDHLLICTELAARFMSERMGYTFEKQYDACEFEDILNAKEGA